MQANASDCQFWGAYLGQYAMNMHLTNCFFDRANLSFTGSNEYMELVMRNCTMRGGTLETAHWSGAHWLQSIRDCAFEGTLFNMDAATDTNYTDFANNAFLRADNWPVDFGIQDVAPLIGDPGFTHPGGLRAADYIPRNAALVKDRGIRVVALPDDEIGVRIGLDVWVDFLGNPVVGAPDLGAIELP